MDGETAQNWRGGVYLIDDLENYVLEVIFQPQLPPLPQEHTDNLWTELNWLRQGILLLQSPSQYAFPPRRSFALSVTVVVFCF